MKKISLFLAIPVFTTPILAVSCINNKIYENLKLNNTFSVSVEDYNKVGKIFDKKIKEEVFEDLETRKTKVIERTLWEKYNYVDGVVDRVVDGDTIWFKIPADTDAGNAVKNESDNKPDNDKNVRIKIRVPLTDTLEEYGDASEREKALAKFDTAFAKQLLPVGSKVRLISDNWASGSYDRKVAYVFFGENYEKQFDIQMLANGFTMLRMGPNDLQSFIIDYNNEIKSSIVSYLAPYAAKAFNKGYTNKKGFYRSGGMDIELGGKKVNLKFKKPQDLSKVFDAHGSSLMSDAYRFLFPSQIEKNLHKLYKNSSNNLFEFLITKQNKK